MKYTNHDNHARSLSQNGQLRSILLLAGRELGSQIDASGDMIVMRMDSDGSLDQEFGDAGQVVFSYGPDTSIMPIDLYSATDGSILVAGSGTYFFSARLNSDGTFSDSYGNGGVEEVSVGIRYLASMGGGAILPLSANRTVVALTGSERLWFESDVILVGLDSKGELDASFGTSGTVQSNLMNSQANSSTHAVLAVSDGRILALATDHVESRTFLARYNPDGSLDPSFGMSGRLDLSIQLSLSYNALLPQFIRSAGSNYLLIDTGQSVELARLSRFGTIMGDAGSQTWTSFPYTSDMSRLFAVATKPDGGLILVGEHSDYTKRKSEYQFLSYRLDGTLVETYGDQGVSRISKRILTSGDGASFCFQSDGSMVALLGNAGDSLFGVALHRILPDGKLDSTFGDNGSVLVPLQTGYSTDQYRQVLCDASDRLVISGTTNVANGFARLRLARFTAQGQLDRSFGNSGLVEPRLHLTADEPRVIALDSHGRVLIAATSDDVFQQDSAIIRLTPDGDYDPSFGNYGIATIQLSVHGDVINTLDFVRGGGDIIAGGWLKDGRETRMTILRLEGDRPAWQNYYNVLDTNQDRAVSPVDAIGIINDLNANGARRLPLLYDPALPKLDVNGDSHSAPSDVIIIINHFQAFALGEGESVAQILSPLPATVQTHLQTATTTERTQSESSARDHIFEELAVSDTALAVASVSVTRRLLDRRIKTMDVSILLDLESLADPTFTPTFAAT